MEITDTKLAWLGSMVIVCLICGMILYSFVRKFGEQEFEMVQLKRDVIRLDKEKTEYRELAGNYDFQDYYEAKVEINENIARGIFYPRINDEIFVYKILHDTFKYTAMIIGCGSGTEESTNYKEVVLLDTHNEKMYNTWIESRLIKKVNSNWGLTQEVNQLNERVERLDRNSKRK